jgi:hypothetical protein
MIPEVRACSTLSAPTSPLDIPRERRGPGPHQGRRGHLAPCPATRLAGPGRRGRPRPLARQYQRPGRTAGPPTVVVDHFPRHPAGQPGGRPGAPSPAAGHPWHRGRKRDPLYRIRKLLLTAAEQLTECGRARLRDGLAAGDPSGEIAVAWQGKELLRAVYAADVMPAARAALDRFYRWSDGVQVSELSRSPSCPAWLAPYGPGRPRSSPSTPLMAAPTGRPRPSTC